jgi:hypothetical protein
MQDSPTAGRRGLNGLGMGLNLVICYCKTPSIFIAKFRQRRGVDSPVAGGHGLTHQVVKVVSA